MVLDQLTHVVDQDQAWAALDLARALVDTAPSGCDVEAIVPAQGDVSVPGLAGVHRLALARRELAASWQMGIAPGVGGGLIHSASLMAPLVRHDRVHDNDQTTVTLWDLRAWDAPEALAKSAVSWKRAMLKRAAKHADAVVVPTHTIGARLAEIAKLGERIRVIPGAVPTGFVVPLDAVERRANLVIPDRYIVVTGRPTSIEPGFRAAVAAGADAVVLDAAEGTEPRFAEIAAAAGLPEARARIRSAFSAEDRAAVLAGAAAFVATDDVAAWPWRAVEAMTLGVPVVARDTGVHRDVVADGGAIVAEDDIEGAVVDATGSDARRLSVLAADRSRAFSWHGAGERVWGLHADL